jgi:lysylphosphatidylglycerol synthetase-like protein (DUF2156 family)
MVGAVTFTFEERFNYLKEFGTHTLAYSTFQPDMCYFDLHKVGYIAYMKYKNTSYVLGDPICKKENFDYIIKEFLKLHKDAVFMQISENIAKILSKNFGFYSTQLGLETLVDVKSWTLKGKDKRLMRHWYNIPLKEGVKVKEEKLDKDNFEDLIKISEEWRKNNSSKKVARFLLREPNISEKETRYFFAHLNGKRVALIGFDPMYFNGKVIGYYANINRRYQNVPHGTQDLIMVDAIEKFRADNIINVSLGLSPLAGIENSEKENKITKGIFKLLYKYGEKIYNFKGLHYHKTKYRGKEHKVFYASKRKFQGIEIYKSMKMINII